MKTKTTGIGIVGLGKVGQGALRLLRKERQRLLRMTGVDCRIVLIAEIRPGAARGTGLPPSRFTRDWRKVVSHPDVDIVIELIGGATVAFDVITAALKNNKHVVTANKALLALMGDRIFPLAKACGRVVGFEGAVCGGIPVIRAIKEGLIANRIRSVFGILNGTANYVLSRMRFSDMSFTEAVREAQKKGFAEPDPTLDIEGIDSAHKLSILASLAFGSFFPFSKIHVEGITGVSAPDIQYAADMGYVIKLLAVARMTASGVPCLSVAPTLLPQTEIIAEVNDEYNGVFVHGSATSHTLYTGKGAGALPTGSAIVSDIIHIASYGNAEPFRYAFYPRGLKGRVVPIGSFVSEFYIRLKVRDKPGVMAKISGILGRERISIATLVQKQNAPDGDAIVVITTHGTEHRRVDAAVKKLNRLSIVDGKAVRMPIINDLYH